MVFGLTRENLSQNALGIGIAIGCFVGSVLAPIMLPPSEPINPTINSTLDSNSNDTLSLDGDIMARGAVNSYIHSLLSFSTLPPLLQWSTFLLTTMLLLLIRFLYQWFCRPFEYVRGYGPNQRLEAAYLRLAGAIPPGYPNTWYKLCDEFEVPSSYARGAFRIDALGETLLVFRLPAKHPFIESGSVEGEVCVLVLSSLNGRDPMTDLASCGPESGVIRWISHECNRMIFVWHHSDNFAVVPPSVADPHPIPQIVVPPQWEIPIIENMENWSYHGRVVHEIACHIQEIPENGADVAHLDYIHGDFLLSWLTPLRHEWEARWDPQQEPEGHIAKLILNQRVTIYRKTVPGTSLDSLVNQVGPALVQLIFPTPFGKVAVIETITPIVHTLQRACNAVYAEKGVPRFLAKIFIMGLTVQFERDLPIWNYKHFLRKPLILKEDGPILRYRRWMRQFYSDPEYQKELQKNSDALMAIANE